MPSRRSPPPPRPALPRIESLRVRNYRALRHFELPDLEPLTALVGPNGSGKSTVFDVFQFLSECFQTGLRSAWDRRGRARELRSRGAEGPISIELKYRERPRQRGRGGDRGTPVVTYHLSIDEGARGPEVKEEWLAWRRGEQGKPYRFLDYKDGRGEVISGEAPDEHAERIPQPLRSPDMLAVSTLGQLAEHPRVAALREFITDWYVSYLSVADTRSQPEAGPQERLSRTGDNLPNVVQYLKEQHPAHLESLFQRLRSRVPRLERILAEPMADGRLLLQLKDEPFTEPVLARFASDGTLKLLAYLLVLMDPDPPRFVGIEEPENFLHPRLLQELAEECRAATERSQLLVTTHSPFFLLGLRLPEVRVLSRDLQGYTHARRIADLPEVQAQVAAGADLGSLWMEGFFDDPEWAQAGGGRRP